MFQIGKDRDTLAVGLRIGDVVVEEKVSLIMRAWLVLLINDDLCLFWSEAGEVGTLRTKVIDLNRPRIL